MSNKKIMIKACIQREWEHDVKLSWKFSYPTSVSGATSRRNCCSSITVAVLISIIANLNPIQNRGPPPNGSQARGARPAAFSLLNLTDWYRQWFWKNVIQLSPSNDICKENKNWVVRLWSWNWLSEAPKWLNCQLTNKVTGSKRTFREGKRFFF